MDRHQLLHALEVLGSTLVDRRLDFHVVIIGGAALLLTDTGSRATQDVDVVAVAATGMDLASPSWLPQPLVEASTDVASLLDLDPDWLNAGAVGILSDSLPAGYEHRLTSTRMGNLTVSTVSRGDLLRLKLYAATDEGLGGVHVGDIVTMAPTAAELLTAETWVRSRFPTGPIPELDGILYVLTRMLA